MQSPLTITLTISMGLPLAKVDGVKLMPTRVRDAEARSNSTVTVEHLKDKI